MKKKLLITYQDIISLDNLLLAWQEFVVGKKSKLDVRIFERNLTDNLWQLHEELKNNNYHHGGYQSFYITDPKLRHIHKASVRDRLLHHAVYRQLYPFFDATFSADSFSCRNYKGTHAAIKRFNVFADKVSQNNTRTCWVLKGDIKKFFNNIDHLVLLNILQDYIIDQQIMRLIQEIISSFNVRPGKGLPLGNLTSQLFVNIYMNEFDQFVKHKLKAKHYIRYADDFVILSVDCRRLINILPLFKNYLSDILHLELHPQKIFIKTMASGVDWLGWINFSKCKILRTKTKRRMFSKIKTSGNAESLASYLGLLIHGDAYKLRQELLNCYWFWQK